MSGDQDTVLRMALGMSLIAPESPWTAEQRQGFTARLARHMEPFTRAERLQFRTPLLDWYWKAHPRSAPIVAEQFDDDREE